MRRSTAPSATTSALRRSSRGCARRSASRSPIHARASRTAASASTRGVRVHHARLEEERVDPVRPGAEPLAVLDREPGQLGDDDGRQRMREVRDQLHPSRGQPRRDRLVHELLDPFAQSLDPAGRERRAHEASDPRVVRRVPLRHAHREVLVEGREQALLEARRALDRQRHPAGGGEALRVADGRLDVGGTGDQPAAPWLDPVDRRGGAEAGEDGIRVGEEGGRAQERIQPRWLLELPRLRPDHRHAPIVRTRRGTRKP